MKITTEPRIVERLDGQPLDPRGFTTDFTAIEHEGKVYGVMNFPAGNPLRTSIAIATSEDGGITFSAPRVILRPDRSFLGATRGMETPDILPPGPGLSLWSICLMGYDQMPERTEDHWSSVCLGLSKAPSSPWTFVGPVCSAVYARQIPNHELASGKIAGGLGEMSRIWVGPNQLGLLATNSYRSKPCIYAAISTPPWLARSWMMSPDPVIEGEGARWASQPHLSLRGSEALCVYAEGPHERIRVARGSPDINKWEVGEILLEPTPGTKYASRLVGPCLLGNRLYFTAVENEPPSGPVFVMSCEVDLGT